MKIADIQLYVNDRDEHELVYTAVMDGFVGTGDSPQEALSNLPEVMALNVLKRLHMMTSEEMSLAHHFLCEGDMTLSDFVEIPLKDGRLEKVSPENLVDFLLENQGNLVKERSKRLGPPRSSEIAC